MDNKLCEIIDLSKKRGERIQRISMKKLDMAASYICLEKCLVYLEMNKIPELDIVKTEMKLAMKQLAELSK